MYSSLVRIQNTFGFFTTVAFVVALFVALSDFISPRDPTVNVLKTTNLQVYVHTMHTIPRKVPLQSANPPQLTLPFQSPRPPALL